MIAEVHDVARAILKKLWKKIRFLKNFPVFVKLNNN